MTHPRMARLAAALGCLLGIVTTASAQATGPASFSPPPPPLLAAPTPGGAAPGQAPAPPLKFRMYALMAQKQDNTPASMDEELKPVEDLLKGLPYNTYQKLSIEERETPEGQDTTFPVNSAYSLVVHPEGNDGQGAEKLDIHVDLTENGRTVKALMAQAAAKPGDVLVLHGMPLAPGDLVVLLQRDPGDQKSQGGQSSQDQQKQDQQDQQDQQKQQSEQKQDQQQEQQEKKEQDQKDQQQKPSEKKDQDEAKAEQQDQNQQQEQPPSAQDMEKATEKKDNQNLESILQSLEDVDRKEQAEVRNQRDRIDFKGDWW